MLRLRVGQYVKYIVNIAYYSDQSKRTLFYLELCRTRKKRSATSWCEYCHRVARSVERPSEADLKVNQST